MFTLKWSETSDQAFPQVLISTTTCEVIRRIGATISTSDRLQNQWDKHLSVLLPCCKVDLCFVFPCHGIGYGGQCCQSWAKRFITCQVQCCGCVLVVRKQTFSLSGVFCVLDDDGMLIFSCLHGLTLPALTYVICSCRTSRAGFVLAFRCFLFRFEPLNKSHLKWGVLRIENAMLCVKITWRARSTEKNIIKIWG